MNGGDRPDDPGTSDEPQASAGIDLAAILRKLLLGLPVLLVCAMLGGAGGFEALRLLPQAYTSSAALLIDPRRPGALGADAAFTNLYVDSGKLASVELILVSAQLLERVVQSEHLAQDPAFGGAHASLPRRLLTWMLPGGAASGTDTPAARQARAVTRLADMVRTTRIGITYVIRVDVTAGSAALAQRLNQALIDTYLADQLETKVAAARRDGQWLTAGLETIRRDLTESENQVEAIRQRYGLVETDGTPGSNIGRQAATEANGQLAQAQGQVAASQAVYAQAIRAAKAGGHPEDLPEIAGSALIAGLRRQQAEIDRRMADLAARYTPQYPERITAEADKRALDAQVALAVQHMVRTLHDQYQTDLARRDTLASHLVGLVGTAGSAAAAEGRVKLQQAERTVQAYQAAYAASLTRLRDVEQQQTRQDAEARVISAPDQPDLPSAPKPAILLGGGMAIGTLLGVGGILLSPYPRRRVDDVALPQATWSLPVLAVAPLVRRGELLAGGAPISLADYVAASPFSPFADSLRLLRMALHLPAGTAQVVQFTSAMPGEGKSTLAASLAVQAAGAGLRTILVDLDRWRPAVGTLLGQPPAEGVADVLAGNVPVATAIRRHATVALDILSAGTASHSGAEAVGGTGMAALIATLRSRYELVVLDSPPVLAVADAILITDLADITLLVCAWRATTRDTIGHAVRMLRAAGAPLYGVVINKAPQTDQLGYTRDLYTYRTKIAA